MRTFLTIFFFLQMFSGAFHGTAQNSNRSELTSKRDLEKGYPIFETLPKDEKLHFLNYDLQHDRNGLIYTANGLGVGIYDGVHWDLFTLPDKSRVFDIAIADDGKIFVCSMTDIGYLESDAAGLLQYTSLKTNLPSKIREDFAPVEYISIDGDIVSFFSTNKIYVWKNQKFSTISKNLDTDKTVFRFHKNLIPIAGEGLMAFENGKLKDFENGQFFTNMTISGIERVSESQWIIGTSKNGIFSYNDGRIQTIDLPANIREKQDKNAYCLFQKLKNGNFVIAFEKGEVVILDSEFNELESSDFEKQNFRLIEDMNEMLWLIQSKQIIRFGPLNPVTIFDDRKGLQDLVLEVKRYNDTLYVASIDNGGISKLSPTSGENETFRLLEQLKGWGLSLEEVEGKLVANMAQGLFVYDNEVWTKIELDKGTHDIFKIKKSSLVKGRLYLGGVRAFWCIEFDKDGRWSVQKVMNVSQRIDEIEEMPDGSLWLGSLNTEIRRITYKDHDDLINLKNPVFESFNRNHGLPDIPLHLFKIEDSIYFGSNFFNGESTLFRFDSQSNIFYKDSILSTRLGLEDAKIILKYVDEGNNLLFTIDKENHFPKYVAWYQNENFIVQKLQIAVEGNEKGTFRANLEAKDSIAWFYWFNEPTLYRYDLRNNLAETRKNKTVIRKLVYNNDSILYGGYPSKESTPVELKFKRARLQFRYALTGFEPKNTQEYQYWLEGLDEAWSPWANETRKDFTNLQEGDYTFKVRGRNLTGGIGQVASFDFIILPPWYRTWWAYQLYALGAILTIWVYSRWYAQQLRKKNLALETLVDERTKEIRHKNKLLGYQTKRLKELDTMKTRLFANISHEFRTPLTLIKGPIEKLESMGENKISTPNIRMIRRNANRLLNLVNQLLDLSKLDSGKLKLNVAEGDVFKCIRAAASAFSSHAASRKMDYQIKIPSRLLWASFDRDKLEKIIYNLLSNAFKFTKDEGRIIVETEFRSSRLRVKVSDTGCGISADKLPHIFDRFFQVDDSYTREKAGSGIGLALTKELVELMGGTIYVESEEFQGTSFRALVPLEEIKSNQIQEPDGVKVVQRMENLEYTPIETEQEKEVKVLIIEDNNDMRHFIKEQLEQRYTIFESVNGKEGLKQANKIIPDLIITDLMMPQMDGTTLCKKLKTKLTTSHIPVIMLTAKAGIENKLEGLETGADEYLTKPFNARELQVRAKNLIQQRQHLRELFSKSVSLEPKEIAVTSLDEDFLNRLLALLEEKYADSEFGVPQMQRALGMSKTSLHGKVKALTNQPPGELLRNFRLKRAVQLLSQKGDNISQVAYDVGFNSLSYFTRCFKQYYKVAPSEYKKE